MFCFYVSQQEISILNKGQMEAQLAKCGLGNCNSISNSTSTEKRKPWSLVNTVGCDGTCQPALSALLSCQINRGTAKTGSKGGSSQLH